MNEMNFDFNDVLLKTSPFGMIIVDENGNILFINDKMKQEHQVESYNHLKCWEFLRDDSKQCWDCPLNMGIEIGITKKYSTKGVLDGKSFDIYHTGMYYEGKKANLELFIDVTEQKEQEQKLIESKKRLKIMFDSSPTAMGLIKERKIQKVNSKMCELTGYSKEELTLRNTEFLYDSRQEYEFVGIEKSKQIEMNGTSSLETQWKTKNGKIIDVLISSTLINPTDSSQGLTFTVFDVTEKNNAQKKINESEKKYRNIFENAQEGIFQTTIDGHYISVNPAMARIYGYDTPEQLINSRHDIAIDTYTDPKEREKFVQMILEQGFVKGYEYEVRRTDGSKIWLYEDAKVVKNENGSILYFEGFVIDITKSKQALDLIKQEKLFSDILIESLPGIFYMFDSNFTPLRWNKSKAELLGLTNEQMMTHNTLDFIADKDKQKIIDSFKKVFIEGESQEIIHITRYDGKELAYHLTGKRLDTEKGPLLLGVGIDVNDREIAEQQLINAKERAEESDRLKTSFLQNMSHEIRTPLNGIVGFAKLLQDEDNSSEDVKQFTEMIQQGSKRLLDIVNNVLDISKIETGLIEIHNKTISLNYLLNDLYRFFLPEATSKQIELRCFKSLDDYNCEVFTDNTKLNQIFSNLINNALKFTDKGFVEFGYNLKDDNIEFFVKDTGIGISKENHKKVFNRFIQIDMNINRGFEGAGLGLAICKGIIEKLCGTIWVESKLGLGSTFYFTVPYSINSKTENLQKTGNLSFMKKSKTKILIAEDDISSYILIKNFLKNSDCDLIHVENGKQAVEMVRNSNDFNFVLMDIKMPVMDGIEATKQIKIIRPDLPIIAQTAYAFSDEQNQILAIGCDDYISKPIEVDVLLELIEKYLN